MECEVPQCRNKVSSQPHTIRIDCGDEFSDFTVCDECAKLMEVIEERSRELRPDNESI